MKKVISLVLALALVLAIAAPAFATAPAPITDPSKLATGGTVKVDGQTSVGTIKVTIPGATKMVINPYGLKYVGSVNGKEFAASDNKTDQIIFPTQYVSSNSTSKLDVYANITGVVAGNAKLSSTWIDNSTHTAGTKYTNDVCLVFETMAGADGVLDETTTEPGWTARTAVPDAPATDGTANSALLVTARGTAYKVYQLDASADTTDDTNTKNMAFRFTGVAQNQPDTPWTDKDKVTATVIFTFNPVV